MISAKSVKKAALLAGADLVGIASTDRFQHYPKERRPALWTEAAGSNGYNRCPA